VCIHYLLFGTGLMRVNSTLNGFYLKRLLFFVEPMNHSPNIDSCLLSLTSSTLLSPLLEAVGNYRETIQTDLSIHIYIR
jgi:hypothetical protein